MLLNKVISIYTLIAGILILSGCLSNNGGDDITGGSVVENELGVGRLFYPDGQPAAHAEVVVYSVSHVPGQILGKALVKSELAAKVQTDSEGRYRLSGLPKGEYNLLANKEGLVAYEDSVFFSSDPVPLANDTLREPGELIGQIELQPNHDPRIATVQVLGTNVFSNVDESGYFVLPNLADGNYLLRIVVNGEPGYTPLFHGVSVRTGNRDTLPSPLRPIFTGIPVITGIHTELDTAKGLVTVSWNKSNYRNLAGYAVLRGPSGSLQPNQPVNPGVIVDTLYVDSIDRELFQYSGAEFNSINLKMQYWVVAISKNNSETGSYFESSTIELTPSSAVETEISIECLDCNWRGWLTIKDTVRIVAHWKSSRRVSKRVSWFMQGKRDTLRAVATSGLQGSDTLIWISPNQESDIKLEFRVQDEKLDTWMNSKNMSVLLDKPTLSNITTSGSFHVGDTLSFTTKAHDIWGHIVREGWDCQGKGQLITSNSATLFVVPREFEGIKCIYTASDDDSNTVSDSVFISIDPIRQLYPFPEAGSSLATLDSSLLGITPMGIIYRYQKDSDDWMQINADPRFGSHFQSPVVIDKSYLFFSYDRNDDRRRIYFDIHSNTWRYTPSVTYPIMPNASTHTISGGGGKVYFTPISSRFSTVDILEFDIANERWQVLTLDIPEEVGVFYSNISGHFELKATYFNNRLNIFIHSGTSGFKNCMSIYAPESSAWTHTVLASSGKPYGPLFHADGKLCLPEQKSETPWGGTWEPGSSTLFCYDESSKRLAFLDTVDVIASRLLVAGDPHGMDFLTGGIYHDKSYLWWYRGLEEKATRFFYTQKIPFYNWAYLKGEYYLLSGSGNFARFSP